jgi:thiol:disulfide interchange protein DsbC
MHAFLKVMQRYATRWIFPAAGLILLYPWCAYSAGSIVPASNAEPMTQNFPELRARLAQTVPELRIDDIRATPIPHLYAVISRRATVLYVDETGQYVLNGHLFEAQSHDDLTAVLLADVSRIDPKILPLEDSFTEVRGNGTRQMYVFSDPDCPYCKKFEQELPEISDVTIHVFLYPIVSLHPNAHKNAEGVWCSVDRARAWQDKLLNDKAPAETNCPNPVDRNVALGEKLGITGTPTIILDNGTVIAGAVPAQKLQTLLESVGR